MTAVTFALSYGPFGPDHVRLKLVKERLDFESPPGLPNSRRLDRLPVSYLINGATRDGIFTSRTVQPGRRPLFRRKTTADLTYRYSVCAMTRSSLKTMMVARDDARASARLVAALSQYGFVMVSAGNGRIALDRLAAGPAPDGILLDLDMPEMDGWEFLNRVKGTTAAATPVIVTTSTGLKPEWVVARGAVGFLHTPFTAEDLLADLRRVLGSVGPGDSADSPWSHPRPRKTGSRTPLAFHLSATDDTPRGGSLRFRPSPKRFRRLPRRWRARTPARRRPCPSQGH